jgi:hypothetical protein
MALPGYAPGRSSVVVVVVVVVPIVIAVMIVTVVHAAVVFPVLRRGTASGLANHGASGLDACDAPREQGDYRVRKQHSCGCHGEEVCNDRARRWARFLRPSSQPADRAAHTSRPDAPIRTLIRTPVHRSARRIHDHLDEPSLTISWRSPGDLLAISWRSPVTGRRQCRR